MYVWDALFMHNKIFEWQLNNGTIATVHVVNDSDCGTSSTA